MKLYADNGYINEEDIINRNDVFIFQVGARGTGKTYGVENYLIRHHKKFIYMRRTQNESDLIKNNLINPFKSWNENNEDMEITSSSINKNVGGFYAREKGVPDDAEHTECIGYSLALSTFANIRGMDFSDVSIIFYDEFIPEKTCRPIKEEFSALMNAYETVNRNRELNGIDPVKLIACANSNDLANPIFLGLEIVNKIVKMMKKGSEEYHDEEKLLSVYMFMNSPISLKKEKTALYKLTTGTEFNNMAIHNIFEIDDSSIRSMPLREYKPLVKIGEMTIYEHKGRQEYYCRCSSDKIHIVYKMTDIDIKRFKQRYNYLYAAYLLSEIIFEDAISMVIFEKVFK